MRVVGRFPESMTAKVSIFEGNIPLSGHPADAKIQEEQKRLSDKSDVCACLQRLSRTEREPLIGRDFRKR